MRSIDQRSASLSAFFFDVDDRREHREQDVGVVPLEAEVTPGAGDVSSAVPDGNGPIQRPLMHRLEVDRRQGEVARQAKGPPQRNEEAIASIDLHRLGNALHDEQALAGYVRVALNAVVLGELEGPVPAHVEAAEHRVLGFQEREHA
jgi:hypothetical protein